jgi:hypothetical protein
MRAKYAGWYTRSPEKLAKIWEKAIFVPDANVLLHCLRHAAPVRDELLRVFAALKESLWIPYQVGLEFHRNRLEVEVGAEDAYERLCQDYQSAFNQASDRLKQLRAHPIISVDAELKVLNKFMDGFRDRMAEARERHPRDEIAEAVDRLTSLLDGRVGDKWPASRINPLKKEGEERYSRKIPPGYKDAKKDTGEFDKYGDLIIWMDMMEKAKAERRPVVFISDDAKEDWWWIHRGRKLGPRPELIEEFLSHSEQEFHIYEFTQFLRVAAQRHPEMKPGVAEIEKSLRDDEKARKRQNDAALESDELVVKITRLEDERERVVSALSGQPDFDGPPVRMDVASLRARLEVLNAELSALRRAELTVLRAVKG